MNNPAKQLQELGVSPWMDNITRAMLRDGTLADYTERFGPRGLTSNPTIFEKEIKSGDGYDAAIRAAGSREAAPHSKICLTPYYWRPATSRRKPHTTLATAPSSAWSRG